MEEPWREEAQTMNDDLNTIENLQAFLKRIENSDDAEEQISLIEMALRIIDKYGITLPSQLPGFLCGTLGVAYAQRRQNDRGANLEPAIEAFKAVLTA